jgi:hypothetical protein
MSFKALKHITCIGIDYAPGDIVPGAASFINLKEMIDWRFLGYATEEEIAAYEAKQAKQKAAEDTAKKAEEEKAKQAEEAAKKAAEDAAKNKK